MNHIPQHYNNVGDLVDHHSIYLPKPKDWRLVKTPVIGQINALPHFRGVAVATNGIHVVIEDSMGVAWVGHLNWFVKDPTEPDTDLFQKDAAKGTKSFRLDEFDELFV